MNIHGHNYDASQPEASLVRITPREGTTGTQHRKRRRIALAGPIDRHSSMLEQTARPTLSYTTMMRSLLSVRGGAHVLFHAASLASCVLLTSG